VPTTLSGVRQMVRELRRGQAVGLLPDHVPPEGQGVWAPFFGRPAYTMTLAAKLVHQTGAAVVMVWGERLAAARGYQLHCLPMPEPLSDDLQTAVEQINYAMEQLILTAPEQYMWGYARYRQPRAPSGSAAGLPVAAPLARSAEETDA
jgi:KDO2-lipid IV(A) lauroyltransferase